MSLHTKPVVPAVPPPNPLHRSMEVVVVTRFAIGRDGWPFLYTDLREKAGRDVSGHYNLREMSLGELAQVAYQQLDRAFFRQGDHGRACLVAQAWT